MNLNSLCGEKAQQLFYLNHSIFILILIMVVTVVVVVVAAASADDCSPTLFLLLVWSPCNIVYIHVSPSQSQNAVDRLFYLCLLQWSHGLGDMKRERDHEYLAL